MCIVIAIECVCVCAKAFPTKHTKWFNGFRHGVIMKSLLLPPTRSRLTLLFPPTVLVSSLRRIGASLIDMPYAWSTLWHWWNALLSLSPPREAFDPGSSPDITWVTDGEQGRHTLHPCQREPLLWKKQASRQAWKLAQMQTHTDVHLVNNRWLWRYTVAGRELLRNAVSSLHFFEKMQPWWLPLLILLHSTVAV